MKKFRELSGKLVVAMLAVTLLIGCAIGGTVAWLTANTTPVVNTFTYGDINIDLFEHNYDASRNTLGTTEVKKVEDYKIIPGVNLPKDPTVRVRAGSEACWLFIKVEQTGTFVQNKVTYSVKTGKDGWTALNNESGVYYREVDAVTQDTTFNILTGNQVTVSENLTKEDIKDITGNQVLKFTAYAVQKDGIGTVEAAWEKVKPATPVTPVTP